MDFQIREVTGAYLGSVQLTRNNAEILRMNVACSRAGSELTLLFPIKKKVWKAGGEASNPWTIIRDAPEKLYRLK
jgi:hypothetical protein